MTFAKRLATTACIFLTGTALSLGFQNCSAPLAADGTSLASSLTSTTIQISSYPSSQQIALGQPLSLSVGAYSVGGQALSYQWYKNGVAIAGATSNSYYVASVTGSDSATYFVQVSDGTNTVTTSTFTIQIGSTSSNTISIASGPSAQTVAPGSLTRFEVIATDSLGLVLSYQWLKNGVAISGQNGSEMYIQGTTSADGGYYSVVVSNGTISVRSNTVLLTVVATSASCAALGGTLYLSHCYIVNRSTQTWSNAQATCKNAGGNLAIITTAAENYFVYSISQTAAWIGAADLTSEGSFVWVDGTATSFSAWSSGEPNGGTNENCAQITPTGYWNDLSCSESRAFVCEI